MMGSIEDPKDGGKVAAAVFGAVIVYAVSTANSSLRLRTVIRGMDERLIVMLVRSSSSSAPHKHSSTHERIGKARSHCAE